MLTPIVFLVLRCFPGVRVFGLAANRPPDACGCCSIGPCCWACNAHRTQPPAHLYRRSGERRRAGFVSGNRRPSTTGAHLNPEGARSIVAFARRETDSEEPAMRRTAGFFVVLLGGLIYVPTCVQIAHAQERKYPTKPIRIIQGFSMGGISDTLARVIGEKIGERLGQPVVVESRPGGGGIVGFTAVAGATPDATRCCWRHTSLLSAPAARQSAVRTPMRAEALRHRAVSAHDARGVPRLQAARAERWKNLARREPVAVSRLLTCSDVSYCSCSKRGAIVRAPSYLTALPTSGANQTVYV